MFYSGRCLNYTMVYDQHGDKKKLQQVDMYKYENM